VFDLVEGGQTQAQVAADFGVSQERVGQIVRRSQQRRRQDQARQLAVKEVTKMNGQDLGIRVGDWRQFADQLPDASVELIFTDPPYHKEALSQYRDLALAAARVLVDGGSLVAYCGTGLLPRVLDTVRACAGLRYYWTICCVHAGGRKARAWRSGVICGWKPMLWFVKGSERFNTLQFVEDCLLSRREKERSRWQQSEVECAHLIEKLTGKGGLIFDPMGGSGTTAAVAKRLGRRWLTCEIDPAMAEKIRERLIDVA
jgi:DNA modification methylase